MASASLRRRSGRKTPHASGLLSRPSQLSRLAARTLPALAPLIIVACGSVPGPLPDRPGMAQGGQPEAEIPEAGVPVTGEDPAGPLSLDPLFLPVREALARGDWLGATLAMPAPADQTTDPEMASWLRFFDARIAYVRGNLKESAATLSELQGQALTETLRRALLAQQLRQAQLSNDPGTVADLSLALWRAGGYGEMTPRRLEATLWSAAQHVDTPPDGRDDGWSSWWSLGEAASIASGRQAAAALESWLGQYPEHPARWRAELLLQAALKDAEAQQAALILPLSGPLERAGDAVHQGAMASYFAETDGLQRLEILDSRRFNAIEDAYGQAIAQGAEVAIGPLGKRQVGELLSSNKLSTPLVTLNRPEAPVMASGTALQLSLAPEDEAQQIARRAFASGGRRALLLRPEGVWGERMERALLTQWGNLGGRVAARAVYGKPATHSQALEGALDIDASAQRSRELRDLFGPLETQDRRRDDLDLVFLLAKSSDEARSLRPLLNYHYAGDLPVYAISTVDSGSDDPAANRDLEGVQLPVMPWRLHSQPPGLAQTSGSFAALHALGADAMAVARRSYRLSSGAGLRYSGFTATITADENGSLLRELPMAEYDRGRLTPR